MAAAQLQALYAAQRKMADALDRAAKAALEAHSVMEQASEGKNEDLAKELAPYRAALKKIVSGSGEGEKEGRPGVDEVNSEASGLYGQLEAADAVPTAAQLAAAAHAEHEVDEALPAWEEFRRTQLPEMNRVIARGHGVAINLRLQPADMPDDGDID
jgi:soluble cytochrome b562